MCMLGPTYDWSVLRRLPARVMVVVLLCAGESLSPKLGTGGDPQPSRARARVCPQSAECSGKMCAVAIDLCLFFYCLMCCRGEQQKGNSLCLFIASEDLCLRHTELRPRLGKNGS